MSTDGPRIALVGSGEYLPAMAPLEASLIGRGRNYVQIPLAAGQESDERFAYWVDLGREQAARLGVTAHTVLARSRADADDPRWARLVAGADLVYLSGGNPFHLANSLRGSQLWSAIVDALGRGVALAGCSAGAMVLGGLIGSLRSPTQHAEPGLGVLPGTSILPHFDRARHWMPTELGAVAGAERTIGIDELTALVGEGTTFRPWGTGRCWVIEGTSTTPISDAIDLPVVIPAT